MSSSAGRRVPLTLADATAGEIVGLLESACERIEVAGSIRRRCVDVGDVEIVAIPRYGAVPTDMFGTAAGDPLDLLHERCERLCRVQALTPRTDRLGRKAWGRKLKWCWYRTLPHRPATPVDIYITTPEQWGVTLAIRTGPADFSRRLVTPRRQGGLCPSHLHFKGWRIRVRASGEPLSTTEERDVFEALGLDWVAPEDRR